MKKQQLSFSDFEHKAKRKQTRRERFLAEMDRLVPWKVLADLVEPHYPKGVGGRPAWPLEVMLRIHFMQHWFGLSDPAMEDALYDMTSVRQFAGLTLNDGRMPDESSILRFRYLIQKHDLADDLLYAVNRLLVDQNVMVRQGTIVDATIIDAPSSTKNASGKRGPERASNCEFRELAICSRSSDR